MLYHY